MSEITRYVVRGTNLSAVADAIRTRGGTSGTLEFPDGFVYAINHIYGGTPNMTDLIIDSIDTYNTARYTVIHGKAYQTNGKFYALQGVITCVH